MTILKYFLLLIGFIFLSACGPLYGQLMKTNEGLKDYSVLAGDILKLKDVKNLLVIGPFLGKGTEAETCIPKEDCIYPDSMDMKFVKKYNDARRFAHGFQEAELFDTEIYLEVYYERIEETTKRLKTMSSLEIQKEFDLTHSPEMLLFGVVKKRDHKIAPLRGVIVDVEYELEFYNPDSRESIVIDIAVEGVFKDDLKTIIQETKNRIAPKK